VSDDVDQLAYPPDDLPGRPPGLRVERPQELWRLHWEEHPSRPKVRDPGRWRFDAPRGEYPVTYVSLDRYHTFVEVYGDTDDRRAIQPNQANRRISVGSLSRSLRVVDLGDAETLSRLRVDGHIYTTIDYARTQLWSKQIRRWRPKADGIRYPGRRSGRVDNLCLFLDRCADALTWTLVGTVESERELVMRACQMFDIVPLVHLAPSRRADWP
jgi:hypothetical protein